MYPLFYSLKDTLVKIFSGRNFVVQIAAFVLTYIIVISDLDWKYFIFMQTSNLSQYLFPAVIIGGTLPIFGLPIFYIYAKVKKSKRLILISWCLAQAAALGWLISSTYKAFTGRVQPPRGAVESLIDNSRDWNFGFMQHGIFWGWPSSHTAVAFAMSFALIGLYPRNRLVFVLATLYAFYIGIGVSTQIHWVSESIAGTLIGTIIGLTVGAGFYKKFRNK